MLDGSESQFTSLPKDLLNIIFNNLDDTEQLNLGLVNKTFYQFYSRLRGSKPFLGTIKRLLKDLIYPYPKVAALYSGLSDAKDEQHLVKDLNKYKEIKSQLNLFNLKFFYKLPPQIVTKLEQYISSFSKKFSLPEEVTEKLSYLAYILDNFEAFKKGKQGQSSPLLFNPVYLHIFLDLLHYQGLANLDLSKDPNHQKLLLGITLLLIRSGDITGYLSLIDLMKRPCNTQPNSDWFVYFNKRLTAWPKKAALLNDYTQHQNLLALVRATLELFRVKLNDLHQDSFNAFIQQFNFLIFYFRPESTAGFLKHVIEKDINFYKLIKLPSELLSVFCIDTKHKIYSKIFADDVDNNLNLLKNYESNNNIDYVIEVLTTVAENEQLFSALPLKQILELPSQVLFLIPQNYKGGLDANWNYEGLCEIHNNLSKFMSVNECNKVWPPEEIKKLFLDCNTHLYNIVSMCEHRSLIFSKLKSVNDLTLFYQCKVKDDATLLGLLCRNGGKEFWKLLLESDNNLKTLITTITENSALLKMVQVKNIDLILGKYPAYYLSLKKKIYSQYSSPEFEILARLAEDSHRFEVVTHCFEMQRPKLVTETNIVQLFYNPTLCKFIKRQQISLDILQTRYLLFKELYDSLRDCHASICNISMSNLINLWQTGLLTHLLELKNQKVFNWVLFDGLDRHCVQQQSRDFHLRDEKEITSFFYLRIVHSLENFVYYNKATTESINCASVILNVLPTESIIKLAQTPFNANQNLLQRICSFSPCLVLCALYKNNFPSTDKIRHLLDFYSQTCLEYTHLSKHAWLLLLYFDTSLITYLEALKPQGGLEAVKFLVHPGNKNLFLTLIKRVSSEIPIDIQPQIVNEYCLPSQFKVDSRKFQVLFTQLWTSKLLHDKQKCLVLFNNFSADDLLKLADTPLVHVKYKNYLQLLLRLVYELSEDCFLQNYQSIQDIIDSKDVIIDQLTPQDHNLTFWKKSSNKSRENCDLDPMIYESLASSPCSSEDDSGFAHFGHKKRKLESDDLDTDDDNTCLSFKKNKA